MAADYVLEGPKWGSNVAGSPGGTITWSFDATVPNSFTSDVTRAFAQWSAAGNIQFQQVASNASITFTYGALDGPGNTAGLASYSFSNGVITSSRITIDNAEGWQTAGAGVVSGTNFPLYLIATHEIGHSIGLDHYTGGPAVMNPTISASFTGLQPSDVNGVRALYGAAPPCYATGTLIRTTAGDVAVEHLGVGDAVVTASGEARPIRWIGRRTLDCSRHPRPEAVWPVRVLANAFGPGLPARDLFLSPDHAVRVTVLDDVLIPVKHLLNDATVAQVPVDQVTYWHVELDSHDILVAEGLPAESFLDTGVRAGFENGSEHMVLHPDFSPLTLDDFCLPLVQDGPVVDAVRTRLIARAMALGWRLTSEDDLHVLADGVAIRPERDGALARFRLPAGARDMRLVSRSFVPERVRVGAGDGRRLGVPVRGVSVVDRHGVTRSLPIGSDLLATGFSFVQDGGAGAWRWTTGDAVLPAALWAGCEGVATLVVETAADQGTLQAWAAPVAGVQEPGAVPISSRDGARAGA
ncbi:Hint domain-containing protein [Methylobacterium nonmethylotrophicum]|uniref:Matrixin family metalloprotease n=1 Tax=Methylobacterium nonmethylotrophicum TaxID=1141884 RepID=A0A4Z0P076_9HYPH|nr:Hint domain-containing protein [Methylobacterium nonmethylotrophicum]TGE02682.1 matrixin family metalloprotease [Methylobacterium nonmethylotrophicum]